MDESQFWKMIEDAWQVVGGKPKSRQKLLSGKISENLAATLVDALDEVIPALSASLAKLNQHDLQAFDGILERKLYDIDRADIHEYTDGSDDGFLYARGFIVACGADYYRTVMANPAVATDNECEEICYLSWHLYSDLFGAMPSSGISRESTSNHAGWPNLA